MYAVIGPDRATRRFAAFVALLALTAGLAFVRAGGQVPLTPDAVRDAIRNWGSLAPLVFIGVFVLRPFIFFPSTLLFLAGGLAFGVGWGTAYAVVGGTAGALVGFAIARALGREFVQMQMGAHHPAPESTPRSLGLVFLLNMIPVVPMTAISYGAGLSSMRLLPFTAAVIAGLTPRAFAYSLFGNSLLDLGSGDFFVALALLAALLVLPLYARRHLATRVHRELLPPGA
jgi:uncharacterized membrane protein YdjX (TVP38/TMEM64 family)